MDRYYSEEAYLRNIMGKNYKDGIVICQQCLVNEVKFIGITNNHICHDCRKENIIDAFIKLIHKQSASAAGKDSSPCLSPKGLPRPRFNLN